MAKLKCPKCFHINPEGQEICVHCNTPLPKIRIEAQTEPTPPPVAPAAEIQFRQGQVVAQRYTVLRLIGRGGMGCIYKVHDNVLGEEVALKTLLPQLARDKLVVERFFNEARIARRLAHQNIVRVHDIGIAGNIIFISMEFLEGVSLRGALDRLKPAGRMPLLQTLVIIDELCAALEYAHQFTIHRDIKPENVMLGNDGRIKLMDFGISKLMADTRLTGASVVMGTPFYMAPEQLRNSRDVDARADVYSVGVMLYELLTGNVPTGVPKPVSEILKNVPGELDAIIAKCVEPDPIARYQDASELRQALTPLRERLASGVLIPQKRTTAHAEAARPMRRLAGALFLACIMAGTAAGVYYTEQRAREQHAAIDQAAQNVPAQGFDALAEWVRRARDAAQARSANAEGPLRAAFTEGERIWRTAEEMAATDKDAAVAPAENALRCYLAVLSWPEGMVFVPPGVAKTGAGEVTVPPFFIDETEVTAGQYRQFCDRVEGGWLYPVPDDYPQEWPIAMVSFYDARAFAAWKGKLLPTEAQWAWAACGASETPYPWGVNWEPGACNAGGLNNPDMPAPVKSFSRDITRTRCWDMAGNVSEWTRTPFGGKEAAPDFGVEMTVRGGNFSTVETALSKSFSLPFEQANPQLGFRCVVEIPIGREFLESVLAAP